MCQTRQDTQTRQGLIMSAFKVQIHTSPGIRKDKQDDQELGEDATGFATSGDYAVLWVADGAPGTKLEFKGLNFGSRILAKYMGECFETVALKNAMPKTPFDDAFVAKFTDELHKQLSVRLADVHTYLKQMKDSVDLDDALEIKIVAGKKNYALSWSATFVGALVDLKNDVCYTVSIGDCVALSDGDLTIKYEIPVPEPEPEPIPEPIVIPVEAVVIPVVTPTVPITPLVEMPIEKAIPIDTLAATYGKLPEPTLVGAYGKVTPPKVKVTPPKVIEPTMTDKMVLVFYDMLLDVKTTLGKVKTKTSSVVTSAGGKIMVSVDKTLDYMATVPDTVVNGSVNACGKVVNVGGKVIAGTALVCNKAVDKTIDIAVHIIYHSEIAKQKELAKNNIFTNAQVVGEVAAENTSATNDDTLKIITKPTELKVVTGKANRLFILWSTPDDLATFKIDHTMNSPCFGEIDNVKSLILMSDGVIPYHDIESKFRNKNPENVWDELKSMNNLTDDDKTAIYFKILGQN